MAEATATTAATETTTEGATETGATTEATTATTESAETAEVEKWKALSRQNEKAAKKAQADLETIKRTGMTEQEQAVAKARDEAKAEARAEVMRDRIVDKVEIAAAGKLADPADAAALLGDLDRFLVGDQIDSKAITSAIDDLLKAKPYLSPQPGSGSGEGGPRGANQPPALNGDPLLADLKSALNIK
jgi:membrane protein involved in colicin uptake